MKVRYSSATFVLIAAGGAAGVILLIARTFAVPSLEKEARSVFERCAAHENREACYMEQFGALTKQYDLERAYAILASLQTVDEQAKDCHYISHSIGAAEARGNPEEWQDIAVNRCPDGCFYGCMHGALEEYIKQLPRGLTPELVKTVCEWATRRTCTHHLGHLILIETLRNVPRALEFCEYIEDTDKRYQCFQGVFMEEILTTNLVTHGLANPADRDLKGRLPAIERLCNSYEGLRRRACWREIAHAAVAMTAGEAGPLFAYCNRAPAPEARAACIRHALVILVGETLQSGVSSYHADLAKLAGVCKEMRPLELENSKKFENQCYATLAAQFISNDLERIEDAAIFCAEREAEFQNTCFALLTKIYRYYRPHVTKEEMCSLVLPENRPSCLNAEDPLRIDELFYE